MQISDLPWDVVCLILQQALHTPHPGRELWKGQFPLLAVCRMWRHIAAPLVYKYVYVVCLGNSAYAYQPANPATGIPFVATNVHLAASTGNTPHVRHVDLKIFTKAEPLSDLSIALSTLREICPQWPKVGTLSLGMIRDLSVADGETVDAGHCNAVVLDATRAMREILPNMTRLEFKGHCSRPYAEGLLGAVAGEYSGQLVRLASRRSIIVPEGLCFGQLTHLNLRAGTRSGYPLPQVLAGSLEALSLRGLPTDFSWPALVQDGGADEIRFPNLRALSLNYRGGGTARPDFTHRCRAHFPVLRSLSVWNSSGRCPALAAAALPAAMDSINVTGSSELIVALSKVEIPETRRLSLIVTTASTSESQRATMLALNRTLRKAVVRAEASLTILDDAIAVDAQAIDWPSLTHVQIAATTQVGTALAIIGRLSGIVHAAFYNILVEGVPDEACLLNGPAAKHTRVAPLNASLQQLALGHEQSAGADEATAATIKYLALALPRLRMLCAWAPVDLRPFIDDYSSVYPHLSGIHFRLGAAE